MSIRSKLGLSNIDILVLLFKVFMMFQFAGLITLTVISLIRLIA